MSLLDQLEQARVFRAEIDYLQTRDEILTADWKSFRAIRPSVYCRLTEMCDEFYDVHLTSDELRQLALEFENLANQIDATPARPGPPPKEDKPLAEKPAVSTTLYVKRRSSFAFGWWFFILLLSACHLWLAK